MATNISNIVFQSGADTPAVSLVNGDTLNLFATGLVVATGTGASPGVLAAGSNIFNFNGDVFSFENIWEPHQLMFENKHNEGNMAAMVGVTQRGLTDIDV